MCARQSGMFSMADALIRTEVLCAPRNATDIVCRTRVAYRWREAVRWGRRRKCDYREVAPAEWAMRAGDCLAVRQARGLLFDYVVQIQMNAPVSMRWELDMGGLRRGDTWLLGAVQTLVEVVGLEIGVRVKVVSCELQDAART